MSATVHGPGETSRQRRSPLVVSARKKEWLTDSLVSLSIANLCFLYLWTRIASLAGDPETRYYETHAPLFGYVWALLADIAILSAGLLLLVRMQRARSLALRALAGAGLLCAVLYTLYALTRILQPQLLFFFEYPGILLFKGSILAALAFGLIRRRERTIEILPSIFLILSPLILILTFNTLRNYARNDLRAVGAGHAAGMLPGSTRTARFVWIVFDELDERLVFPKRPARVQLPQFDRLRSEAVYANRVRTAAEETLRAIPSMLLGKVVTDTKIDTSTLLVKTDANAARWTNFASANVFQRARSEGFNTAVSGWNHPYCRIIGRDLSDCAWDNGGWTDVLVERQLRQMSPLARAIYMIHWQARLNPRVVEPPKFIAPNALTFYRTNNIAVTETVWDNARRMLQNPKLNLVFLHFPVPHPPGIWDPKNNCFTTGPASYVDNLELADRLLGQIRSELESSGQLDRTAILVTGDHSYRSPLWHEYKEIDSGAAAAETGLQRHPFVPLLLKLPGQHREVDYHGEFNNFATADLALDVLNGKLSTPEDAVHWLETHAPAEDE